MALPRTLYLHGMTLISACACLLVSVAWRAQAETNTQPVERPVVLLTGFEVFGEYKTNASWEAIKGFEGQDLAGCRIVTVCLPVVYDEMAAPLEDAVAKHKPVIVISFGVGTSTVRVETIARNGYHHTRPKDNKSKPPPRERIDPVGPDQIPTQLPTAGILAALKAAKIGAETSVDAGGYLCNECFYRVMTLKPGACPLVQWRGFVHVPDTGWKDAEGGEYTLEKLRLAVRIVAAETVKAMVAKPVAPK